MSLVDQITALGTAIAAELKAKVSKSDIRQTIPDSIGVTDAPPSASLMAITYDGLAGVMDGRYPAAKAMELVGGVPEHEHDSLPGVGGSVAVQPDEPAGTDEGALWYDTDDNPDAPYEAVIEPGTAADYWRGDKTWQPLDKAAVGLDEVPNVDSQDASNLDKGTVPVERLGTSGTRDANSVLLGDNTWGVLKSGDAAASLAEAWAGEWNALADYAQGKIVQYSGKLYTANKDITPPAGALMQVGYVGAVSGNQGNLTLPLPAGTQPGDLLVLTHSQYNGVSSNMGISGGAATAWTALQDNSSANGTYTTYASARYRIATAADVGATLTVTVTNNYGGASLTVFRGHAGNPTFAANASNGVSTGGVASTASTFTPSSDGFLLHTFHSMMGSQTGAVVEFVNAQADKAIYQAPTYFVVARATEPYTAGSGAAPVRQLKVVTSNSSGFAQFSIHVPGTPVFFNPDEDWDELPPLSGPVSSGVWELIETKGVAGNISTYGGLFFAGIPAKYTKLLVKANKMGHSSTSGSHLYVRFNQDTGSNYGTWMAYHTSAADSATTESNQAQGTAIYSYFYGGVNRVNTFQLEIANDGLGPVTWDAQHKCHLAVAQYPYGTRSQGICSTVSKAARIDLFASVSATWNADTTFSLYGMVE